MHTLVICSSANFYEHVVQIQQKLTAANLVVIIPKSAQKMKDAGDYTVNKTWYTNPNDYVLKADLVRTHFDNITTGDAVLVVNDEKHGRAGYIGPNVLMEMSLAWYQHKPIYLLNAFDEESPFEEEIKAMEPIILHGDFSKLTAKVNHE